MPTAIKLSDRFADQIRREARLMRRSMARQLEYWVDLGKQYERLLGADRVRQALEGQGSIQQMTTAEDARYLDQLGAELEALDGSDRRALQQLEAGGHPIAGEDEQGRVVVKRATRTAR